MFGYNLTRRIRSAFLGGALLGITCFGCQVELLDYSFKEPQRLEEIVTDESYDLGEDAGFDSDVYNPTFDAGNYDIGAQNNDVNPADPDLGNLSADTEENNYLLPIAVLDCPQNRTEEDNQILCNSLRDEGIGFNGCNSYDPDSTRQLSYYEFSEQVIENPGNIDYETINSQGFWLRVPNCNLNMMFGGTPGYFAFCLRVTNDLNRTSNPTCLSVRTN